MSSMDQWTMVSMAYESSPRSRVPRDAHVVFALIRRWALVQKSSNIMLKHFENAIEDDITWYNMIHYIYIYILYVYIHDIYIYT